jgi:glycerate-2-kinase
METGLRGETGGRTPREILWLIAEEAIRSCDAARAVTRAVAAEPGRITLGGRPVRTTPPGRLIVLAIGKAAEPMYEAFRARLAAAGSKRPVRALVVHPAGSARPAAGKDAPPRVALSQEQVTTLAGEHPVPGKGSMRAGAAALRLLASARSGDDVVALVSGGGSSLLEAPLVPFVTPKELERLHQVLVVSGAPIGAINTVRKHLSALKGGRLAALARQARSLSTLIVCDVDLERFEEVASGPTVPDRTTLDDMVEAVSRYGLAPALPERVLEGLRGGRLPETAKPKDPIFKRAKSILLLSNLDLRNAAVRGGLARGLSAEAMPTEITGPVDETVEIVARAIEGAPTGLRLLVLGGEPRTIAPAGGQGGRAQDLALRLALRMRNLSVRGWAFVATGSDGRDGSSPAAGAFIDSTTLERARAMDLDPEKMLARGDSYKLFHRLGDALVTGPTSTNVRDLYLLLTGLPRKDSPAAQPPAAGPRTPSIVVPGWRPSARTPTPIRAVRTPPPPPPPVEAAKTPARRKPSQSRVSKFRRAGKKPRPRPRRAARTRRRR